MRLPSFQREHHDALRALPSYPIHADADTRSLAEFFGLGLPRPLILHSSPPFWELVYALESLFPPDE